MSLDCLGELEVLFECVDDDRAVGELWLMQVGWIRKEEQDPRLGEVLKFLKKAPPRVGQFDNKQR
jgi:hypothetical protein